MAYASQNVRLSSIWAARIATLIHDYRISRERNRLYRQTLKELSALSDRDLDDLGLHRANLNQVAWQAAHRN